MSKTDEERKKFEAWVLKEQCPRFGWNENVLDRRKSSDEYFYADIRKSWEVWQACAASKDAEIQVNRRLCEALREALRKVMDATPHSMRQDAEAWADAERVLAETEAV